MDHVEHSYDTVPTKDKLFDNCLSLPLIVAIL